MPTEAPNPDGSSNRGQADPPKPGASEPYELASDAGVPVAAPVAKSASNPAPDAKIDEVRLLDDFDEDADFSEDPEVERAMKGGGKTETTKPNAGGESPGEKPETRAMSRPGRIKPHIWAAIGGACVLGAAIAAAVFAPERKFPAALAVVYLTLFHTATGLLALVATAQFAGRPFGKIDHAAARMLTAVGLFSLFFHVQTSVLGRVDELVMAVGSYWLALTLLFQNGLKPTFIVAGLHGVIWGATALAHALASWADAARP